MKIAAIDAYQIFDSRGNPTLEVELRLENGVVGYGLAPSGASTGQFEAVELRDSEALCFRGLGVGKAARNVRDEIAPALMGRDARQQAEIDRLLIALDGTPDKSRLGANAILGVSMAAANASAKALGVPLHEYLGEGRGVVLPLPEVQILGGGAHADGRTDIQDYLVIACDARSYSDALETSFNIYHAAKDILRERGKLYGVADEGGFWPDLSCNEEGLQVLVAAIERAGYIPGRQAAISLDIAASDLYDAETQTYRLRLDDRELHRDEYVDLILQWCRDYPIVSLEDPLADVDLQGWRRIRQAAGDRLQLVGDDLFCTNSARITQGIAQDLANSVLIKPNQVGTVTETLEAIRQTQQAGWLPIVSARSGETEDAFISHLAVATNAGQLKVGSFARSERMVKWNECLRIERRLGERAEFQVPALLRRACSA